MNDQHTAAPMQGHTLLLLRWVLIIATSYLVLFSRPLSETPPLAGLFVAAYLGSNLLLTALLPQIRRHAALDIGIVLFDTAAVCAGLALTANAGVDFFPVYFLVVFVGALTERLRLVVVAALLISVVHLWTLSHFVGLERVMDTGYILRVPFLFVVALFFGSLVQEARSRQRLEQTRARRHRRTELLAAVTHDLKNPLGVIQSLATLLLDHDAGPLNPDQTDLVRRIHANVRRAIQLAVNLLNAARIEEGRLTLHRSPVNLCDVVEDALALVRTASDLKGVTLRFAPDPGLPTVDVDVLQIERVVANLLDNAIKYTPKGGTVSVATRWSLGQVDIEVRDNGPGVTPNELPHLFEKYQRGHDTTRIEGSGLGLFIVKALVEAHGGTVAVESVRGHGSTVTVRLPTVWRGSERDAPAPAARLAWWRALCGARRPV
jgi:signal transduction histidine kinase